MPTTVNSIYELMSEFPHQLVLSSGEVHTPCPFCNGTTITHKGRNFVGNDRLVWYKDGSGVYCRREGRLHSIYEVAEFLFGSDVVVSSELIELAKMERIEKDPEPILQSEAYVEALTKAVDKDFWHMWSDTTLDRFKIGYGKMYAYSKGALRHIIPFHPRTIDKVWKAYAFEGRLPKDDTSGEQRNIKSAGLAGTTFWYVNDDEVSKTLFISEGPKDGVSAWQLGYKNFMAIFGAGFWKTRYAAWIAKQGYTKVILAGDNDDAGADFVKKAGRDLQSFDIEVSYVKFTQDDKKGFDVTDHLVQGRALDVKPLPLVVTLGMVQDFRTVDPNYVPAQPQYTHYSQIRGDLEEIIREYVNSKRDTLKLLATPPGTGKSYALVRIAEELARKRVQAIQDSLKDKNETPKNINYCTVAFLGLFKNGWQDIIAQGADMSLWFNQEARNEDNCENLLNVTDIANKGYAAMSFCKFTCPVASRCAYLKAQELRKKFPITYFRQQSLLTAVLDDYNIIMIDEDPTSQFDTPLVAEQSDLRPVHDAWDNMLDREQARTLDKIVHATRLAMGENAGSRDVISGTRFIALVDKQLDGKLKELLDIIPDSIIDGYQPSDLIDITDLANVPKRAVEPLIRIMKEEWEGEIQNKNTRIHLVNGSLELYDLVRVRNFSRRKRVVVCDGTPFVEKYEIIFGRRVEVYAPELKSDLAETVVYYGSDVTRSTVNQALGWQMKRVNNQRESKVLTLDGKEYDLGDVPVDDTIFENPVIRNVFKIALDKSKKHNRLLVVSYQSFIPYLKYFLDKKGAKNISYGHYGALRGTNLYKDHDAVLLVGVQRQPYAALYRRISAWGLLAGADYIDGELAYHQVPYHGHQSGASAIGFVNEFANKYAENIECAEAIQCYERIRLHTSDEKRTCYIIATRPLAKWVDRVVGFKETVNTLSDKRQAVMADMMNFYVAWGGMKHKPGPQVVKDWGISYTDVTKFRKEIEDVYNATTR